MELIGRIIWGVIWFLIAVVILITMSVPALLCWMLDPEVKR